MRKRMFLRITGEYRTWSFFHNYTLWTISSQVEVHHSTCTNFLPHLDGSVVSGSDSCPGGCKFNPQLRQTFLPAYFCLSPLQKHVRKVVGGFGKKVVLVLVLESQETHVRHRPPPEGSEW